MSKAAITIENMQVNHSHEYAFLVKDVVLDNTNLDDLVEFCRTGRYPEQPVSYVVVTIGSDNSIHITKL
jgi:hypothetical protein